MDIPAANAIAILAALKAWPSLCMDESLRGYKRWKPARPTFKVKGSNY
jgi:hypothetical protein